MTEPLHARFSRRERQIMDALFALGEGSAQEVVARLGEPDAFDSVRVTLGVLERKGWVAHRQEGIRNIYYPTVAREKARDSAMRHLTRTFFEGSSSRAILAFLDGSVDELTDEELDEIARRIERRKEGT